MSGLLLILELFLPLEGLDKGLLGQVLGIGAVADNAVNLHKDPPQVLVNKAVLPLEQLQSRVDDFAHLAVNDSRHGFLTR